MSGEVLTLNPNINRKVARSDVNSFPTTAKKQNNKTEFKRCHKGDDRHEHCRSLSFQ